MEKRKRRAINSSFIPCFIYRCREFNGDVCKRLNSNAKTTTYSKYVKFRLMGPRFRLYPVVSNQKSCAIFKTLRAYIVSMLFYACFLSANNGYVKVIIPIK